MASNEFELIRLCASVAPDDVVDSRIRDLAGVVDFDVAFPIAVRHGLQCLVYQRLSQSWPGLVDSARLARFRSEYYSIARQSQVVLRELCEITSEFRTNGIETVLLKGIAIAHAAYGDVTLRPPGDIDLLLPRDDIPAARTILNDRGYSSTVAIEDEDGFLASQLGYEFLNEHFCVELHWSFLPRTLGIELNMALAFEATETVQLGHCAVNILAFEDRMLFLTAHGAKHCWDTLKWVRDVAGLIERTPDADWDTLLSRAETSHCERILLLGLHLAVDVAGATLPENVLRRIEADSRIPELRNMVFELFLDVPVHISKLSTREHYSRAIFHLRVRDRARDRLPYVAHLARLATQPTARDKQVIRLRGPLRLLYPIVRGLRLGRRYGTRFIRRAAEVIRNASVQR